MAKELSHIDATGKANMVDVSEKAETNRIAVAQGDIRVSPDIIEAVKSGTAKKGDVLGVARVAGIMAAKKTADLIPLCHPLQLTGVDVTIERTESGAQISVEARLTGRTGVEMEAMTGAAVGALALYDMVKGIDRSALISSVRLVHKSGGKSGQWNREPVEP